MRLNKHNRLGSGINPALLTIAALVAISVVAGVWALTLHSQLGSLENELAGIRENANASIHTMEATDVAPPAVHGQVWLGLSGSGVVQVTGLPATGDNESYTVWVETSDGDKPVSIGTLTLDPAGTGFTLIPADIKNITRVGVSLEATGSGESTPNYLLLVDIPQGRG